MSRNRILPIIATAALCMLAATAYAQSASPPGAAAGTNPAAEIIRPALRVQLVITRFEGEKKLGSLPYIFVLTPTTQPNMTRIRMGVDVPVPKPTSPTDTNIQYQNVGTNIDVFNLRELAGGRYRFDINVQNSTALPAADSARGSAPLFRRFESTFTASLRDGQSMQTIASADPVTGEVVKIDVTLNVIR